VRRLDFAAAERRRRSRVAQMVTHRRLLRGSLTIRKNTCGKPNCRCGRGEPHLSLYVTHSHNGRPRQLFVPKSWEARVRQAVEDYQELQKLIEELSEIEWQHLEHREE
jgi:hypothetical protein